MSDVELKAAWDKIEDPHEMLAAIVEHSDFLGYDPYYADLRNALLDNANRLATKEK